MKILLVLAVSASLIGLSGCATSGPNGNKKTLFGAGVGTAVGAGVGAIIGHQSGNRDKGALIGAMLGGSLGGVVGRRLDKQAAELAAVAETRRTEQGIVTKLKGDLLFSSGSSALSAEAQSNLSQISGIMKKYPENIVTVIGHTDSQGSDSANMNLSEQRAKAVKSYMATQGISPGALNFVGMGESSPIAANTDANGRQMNRRVELNITVDPSKVPQQ